jgi:hypothetical protein
MSLRFEDNSVYFEENCAADEALVLSEYLRDHPGTPADLRNCTYLHTSLMQVLLAREMPCVALPEDPFMARWLPALLETCALSGPQDAMPQQRADAEPGHVE